MWVKALNPALVKLFPALFGCLSKHSMHKKQEFEGIEKWVGLKIKKVPQFLDVRFRAMQRCSTWMETHRSGSVPVFQRHKEQGVLNINNYIDFLFRVVSYQLYSVQMQAGEYVASKTEMIVLEEYMGSYLEVWLTNSFLVEVCKLVIQMIEFFESNSVRIQYQYKMLGMLLFDFLSKMPGCPTTTTLMARLC